MGAGRHHLAGALIALAVLAASGCTQPSTNSEPTAEAPMEWKDIEITPVIVELDRTQERRPQNGGSAVLLFTQTPEAATQNLAACEQTWSLMDTATVAEIKIGVREAEDGALEALRPLYWLTRTFSGQGASCEERLAVYDFPRAATIRSKYGLQTNGPHFVVARADERAAAVIDLTGRSDAEIAQLTRYFRDGFAFERDIWDPARTAPERKRAALSAFFGQDFKDSLVAALGFVSSPAAQAGCRLGDLNDFGCAS